MEPYYLSRKVIAFCHESDPVLLLLREASVSGVRVRSLLSIGHIPPGSPPTLLSVFEKPILIFVNFSNGRGGFARITRGGKIRQKSGYGGGNAVIFCPVKE
ncbi:MAG: hypothetical protein NPIRA06_26340 [Nitrospirales bacterium]|nr:MAG: hypothetical protein NPIRA06_26340 [Nitrospirales bacterium]